MILAAKYVNEARLSEMSAMRRCAAAETEMPALPIAT